jgi:hypothetical protein
MPIAPKRSELLWINQRNFSHTKTSVLPCALSPLEKSSFSQKKIKPAGASNGNADLISRIIERK